MRVRESVCVRERVRETVCVLVSAQRYGRGVGVEAGWVSVCACVCVCVCA